MLPSSTWRMPVRPSSGATMVVYCRMARTLSIAPGRASPALRAAQRSPSAYRAAGARPSWTRPAWCSVQDRSWRWRASPRPAPSSRPPGRAGLEGGGVDLRQHVAALDVLAFVERDLDELAFDLRAHRDGVERPHGADAVEIDRNIGAARGAAITGTGPVAGEAAAAWPDLLGPLDLRPNGSGAADHDDGNQGNRQKSPLAHPNRPESFTP